MFQRLIHRANVVVGVILALGASTAQAGPSVIGTWATAYGPVLGLQADDLPFENEFIDRFTAIVEIPDAVEKYGLTGVAAGDKLELQSHRNGYWTIRHLKTYRAVKVALGWHVRFGIEPDKILPDGEPANRIEGKIVSPRILAGLGFKSAREATGFVFEFDGGSWTLTLLPQGESKTRAM